MRLNTALDHRTLGEIHASKDFDLKRWGVFGCDAKVRFNGNAFVVLWHDNVGAPRQTECTSDADAYSVARHLTQHGCPPYRPKERKTLRNLIAVGG